MTEEDRDYRRGVRAWILYDVGNSAFVLTVLTAVFPFFFQELYARGHAGEAELAALRTRGASSLAGWAAAAMAATAVLGPLLGTLADRRGWRKRLLAAFAALGIASSAGLAFVGPAAVGPAGLLYALGTLGVAGSFVFYDALLPGVARPEDLDRVSSRGFAAGYLGSVLLFGIQSAMILKPGAFGLADADAGARASFLLVAAWWAAFTVPVLLHVRERTEPSEAVRGEGLWRGLRSRPGLLLFLAAFWCYSDGIGTIIKMSTAFGFSLGLGKADLLGALVLTQLLGVPCAMAFGRLARARGPRPAILLGLGGYLLICVGALFMSRPWHFWVLAGGVGVVQGGTQALSRSLYASMIPAGRSASYFGLFSTVEKFAGILGPLMLSWAWSGGGDPRPGVALIALFFIAGALLLARLRKEPVSFR